MTEARVVPKERKKADVPPLGVSGGGNEGRPLQDLLAALAGSRGHSKGVQEEVNHLGKGLNPGALLAGPLVLWPSPRKPDAELSF